MRAMLGEFLGQGSLVFDVGANHGVFTEVFDMLGARVVAIEPNPDLISSIRARAPRAMTVQAAVGSEPGETDLWLGAADGVATVSPEYKRYVEQSRAVELSPRRVPVVTLDMLLADHGTPDFIKIDVEGYEGEVLRGLTVPVKALSFEFHVAMLDDLDACLLLLDDYQQFRISVGTSFEWACEWGSAAEIRVTASLLHARWAAGRPDLFADVYAKRFSGP